MSTKTCPICGNAIALNKKPSYVNSRTYCSRDCFNKRNPHKCKTCNRVFYGGEKNAVYCSRECQNNIGREIVICAQCGVEFNVIKGSHRKYCSHKCSDEVNRYKRMKRVVATCKICGKTFEDKACRGRQYCSRKCFAIHQTQTRGVLHPLFKGGVSTYRGANWSIQRDLARARDNYTCQICHKVKTKNSIIHVHHIKPYRTFNGDYVSANQLANLICLCPSCHKRVENGLLNCPRKMF